MTALTDKQEAFCRKKVETGNASEAYRLAYDADAMKPETINRKAAELMNNGKITARIAELQAEHRQAHDLTVNDLLNELEEARKMAEAKEQAGAMIQATMGKVKLLGFDKAEPLKIEVNQPKYNSLKELYESRELEELFNQ